MLEVKQEYENTKDKKLLKDISRYNNIQMLKKISLNSAYGAIGNAYFRYYNLLIAEGITTSGQLSIRWIESDLNRYLNKVCGTTKEDFVIASDTDSVYITFDRLVNSVVKKGHDTTRIERQQLSTHWTVSLKIRLNLLLIRVIQNLLRISIVIPKE